MGYWCTEPEVKAVNSEMVKHHLQEVIFWVSDQNGIPSAAILLLRDLLVDSFWSHFHRQLPVFLFSHYLHHTRALGCSGWQQSVHFVQQIRQHAADSPTEQKLPTTTCRTLRHHLHRLCRPPVPTVLCQLLLFVTDLKMCSILPIFCCSAHFSAVSCSRCCVSGTLGNVVCQSRVFMLLTWPVWVTFFQPINFINPWRGSFYWGH